MMTPPLSPPGSGQAGDSYSRRACWRIPLAITALALALRLFRLGSQNIWIDEAFTARLLDGTFLELIKATARDNHPPLYYAVLYLLRSFGRGEIMLRLPSVIFGVATIPVAFTVARRLFGLPTATYTALLLAVSPLHVFYSQEARMYALFLFLITVVVAFFARVLEGGRATAWTGYAAASILAFYTHIEAFFVPLALGIFYLVHRSSDRNLRACAAAYCAIGLFCLPWVLVAIPMLADVQRQALGYVSLSPFALPYTFFTFCLGYFVGPSVADWHRSLSLWQLVPDAPAVALTVLTFGGLFLLGLWKLRHDADRLRLCVLLLSCTILGPYAMARLLFAKYNVRYAITALPVFLMLVAFGLTRLATRTARLCAFGVLLLLSAHALYNWYFNAYYGKERVRDAVEFVRSRIEPGDILIVVGVADSVRYYWPGRHFVIIPTRSGSDTGGFHPIRTHGTRRRTWLIYGREWDGDPAGEIRGSLEKHLRPTLTAPFPGVTVTLYTRPARERHARATSSHACRSSRSSNRPILVRLITPAGPGQLDTPALVLQGLTRRRKDLDHTQASSPVRNGALPMLNAVNEVLDLSR